VPSRVRARGATLTNSPGFQTSRSRSRERFRQDTLQSIEAESAVCGDAGGHLNECDYGWTEDQLSGERSARHMVPANPATALPGVRRNSWLRLQGREGVLFLLGIVLIWQFVSSSIHFAGAYLFPSPTADSKSVVDLAA